MRSKGRPPQIKAIKSQKQARTTKTQPQRAEASTDHKGNASPTKDHYRPGSEQRPQKTTATTSADHKDPEGSKGQRNLRPPRPATSKSDKIHGSE